MSYTAKDMERADKAVKDWDHWNPDPDDLAQLIADVRREALEEAAMIADHPEYPWGRCAAERIRALKDGAP